MEDKYIFREIRVLLLNKILDIMGKKYVSYGKVIFILKKIFMVREIIFFKFFNFYRI